MVWRWQVGGSSLDQKVYLNVQALPCSLDVIKATPSLRTDSTRAIYVSSFFIGYRAFKNIPGPIPMFFSQNPPETQKYLNDTPRFAFDCMQMLLGRLLETEQITREEADAFLANPTVGKTKAPLVRTWESMAGETSGSTRTPTAGKKLNQNKRRHLIIVCAYNKLSQPDALYILYLYFSYCHCFRCSHRYQDQRFQVQDGPQGQVQD
jgi:hypothetical protein